MAIAGGFPQIAGAGDPVISCGFLWQPVDSRAKRGRTGDCKAASARGSCGFADHMSGRQRGAGAGRIVPKTLPPFRAPRSGACGGVRAPGGRRRRELPPTYKSNPMAPWAPRHLADFVLEFSRDHPQIYLRVSWVSRNSPALPVVSRIPRDRIPFQCLP